MKRDKRGKCHNRALAILLMTVLLAMQTLPAAIAEPLFSYALNESDLSGDEIIQDPEYEEEEDKEIEDTSEIEEEKEPDKQVDSEGIEDEDTEKPSEIVEKTESDKEIEVDTVTPSETEEKTETDKDAEVEEETKEENKTENETEETSPEAVPEKETEETDPETVPEKETEETSPEAVPEKETPNDPPKKLMLKGTRGVSSYLDCLTDRSNDIGVPSEGYEDSTYTVSRDVWPGTSLNARDSGGERTTGGTFWINKGLTNNTFTNDQYWDGRAPFRITPQGGQDEVKFTFYNYDDFALEDDDDVVPRGALKLDHLILDSGNFTRQNFYARGNKLVIGEGVTTMDKTSELIPRNIDWRIYGGTEHNADTTSDGRPDVFTNNVVASGHWNYVFGGGEGATGTGTQVTIRGDANVDNVFGGGERKGSIGVDEPIVNGHKGNPNNPGINVYVEGGNVGTLYGGSAINGRGFLTGTHAIQIYEDIHVNVSGGYVDRIFGGDDTHDDNGDSSGVQPVDHSVMSESPIEGDVFVNLSGPNVARQVVGDINRNIPRAATEPRQVLGANTLNITADQELDYMELFDFANIDGANVKINNELGFTTFDSDYSSTEGYIGQISVKNGGRLELTKRAVINVPYAHYDSSGRWNNNWTEPDRSLKATGNHTAKMLRHGWTGETSEAARADSVIAINGQTADITAASGTAFNDNSDICGLLIHGSVGGDSGWDMQGSAGAPGYSTLEVLGDPIYSSGDNYYYYIVADGTASNRTGTISKVPTSVNGGAAFKEPEGADYIVCYRYLEGGKIGWYLRQRPEVTGSNVLSHKGDDSDAANVKTHIDLNAFKYEWSDDADSNFISLKVTRYTGTDSVTDTDVLNISRAELANIENDNRFSNIVYDSDGYLESFDLVIDGSRADEASYYDIDVIYEHDAEEGGQSECSTGNTSRSVYDFVSGNSESGSDQDSIMTTTPYFTEPRGQDTAKLVLELPYGCEASGFSISENDGSFNMNDEYGSESVAATLHSIPTVMQNYNAVTTETANSAFAVEIGGGDLSEGITKSNVSGANEYLCTVLSYKNVNKYEISPESADGLRLVLALSGITKDGSSVGSGAASATNNGELRIRTIPLDSEIVPPITGMHTHAPILESIWLLMAVTLILIVSYIKLKKHRRWSDAGG